MCTTLSRLEPPSSPSLPPSLISSSFHVPDKPQVRNGSPSSYGCHLQLTRQFARFSISTPDSAWHCCEACARGSGSRRNALVTHFIASPLGPRRRPFGSESARFIEVKGARASGLAVDGGLAGTPLAINIRNLALNIKSDRGDVPVLKECSLNIPKGQFWMLLGPNGCGKSTLLKAMAGLLRPNRGHMYVIGPRSFVFQNPDHQVVMPTAEADVAFGMGRFKLPDEEVRRRVHEALEAVGMAEYAQRSVQTLSGGQKQRIAIAGALAECSCLLLLDELTTYLDSGDQVGVLEAVRKVVGGPQEVTALWVTHRLEELDYADGAAYMQNGRVVLNGCVGEIKAHIKKQQEEFLNGQGVFR